MNYKRIYEYRFQGVNIQTKRAVWTKISEFMFQKMGKPEKLLDPAAGLCEFINTVPSKEKWAVDINSGFLEKYVNKDVKIKIGNILEVDLPVNYFDGIFVSNFLEHLYSQEEVAVFLERMYKILNKGGRIAIMGPNFKYASKEYFDFADHTVILSELGVAEHLFGAGFEDIQIYPRFLPLSFRGKLPVHPLLVKLYLRLPFAWQFVGKQFLLIAQK
jgi:ubiquinone/menaquinone biosynthesis C-methylase UbiE